MTGSWRQYDIEVEPNENLLFSAVVKMESGKVLMYFMGYDDNGKLVYDNRRLYLTAAAEHPSVSYVCGGRAFGGDRRC